MDTMVRRLRRRSGSQVRGRAASSTRSPTRSTLGAAGRRGGGVFRLPEASSQHQPGDLLRVQRLQPDAGSRPQNSSATTASSSSRRCRAANELAGRDVILVHRLLKNGVNERLGGHAYAAVFRALHPAWVSMRRRRAWSSTGGDDIIGEVTCWVRDLEAAWQQEKDRQMNQ